MCVFLYLPLFPCTICSVVKRCARPPNGSTTKRVATATAAAGLQVSCPFECGTFTLPHMGVAKGVKKSWQVVFMAKWILHKPNTHFGLVCDSCTTSTLNVKLKTNSAGSADSPAIDKYVCKLLAGGGRVGKHINKLSSMGRNLRKLQESSVCLRYC